MINKLKEDFPNHTFEIENVEVMLRQLKIDGKFTCIKFSTAKDLLLDKNLQEDADEAVYRAIKQYVKSFLSDE